jgi:hypothetical protein
MQLMVRSDMPVAARTETCEAAQDERSDSDEFRAAVSVVHQETARMRTGRLTLIAVALLGACVASVEPSPSSPPPPRETRREPPPPPPPERHRDRSEPRIIEGRVRDAVTHQPIDRASVDVTPAGARDEITVQTGPDGRYRTGELPRGEIGIRVRHEGYEPARRTAEMSDGIAHLDFELVPKRR